MVTTALCHCPDDVTKFFTSSRRAEKRHNTVAIFISSKFNDASRIRVGAHMYAYLSVADNSIACRLQVHRSRVCSKTAKSAGNRAYSR